MEVDTATSAIQTPARHLLPELEIYCYLLVLLFLIDQKKYKEVGYNLLRYFQSFYFLLNAGYMLNYYYYYFFKAKTCSSASIVRLKNLNRRTVDVIASRLYFYYSYSYELTGDLAEIRG